jgi:hypothetical protein
LASGGNPPVVTFPQWHGPVLGADQRGLRSVEHLAALEALLGCTGQVIAARRVLLGLVDHDLVGIVTGRQVPTGRTNLLSAPTAFLPARPLCLGAPLGTGLGRLGALSWRVRGRRQRGVLRALAEAGLELGDLGCQSPDLASECTVVFSERLDLLPQHRVLGEQRLERAVPIVIRHVPKSSNISVISRIHRSQARVCSR